MFSVFYSILLSRSSLLRLICLSSIRFFRASSFFCLAVCCTGLAIAFLWFILSIFMAMLLIIRVSRSLLFLWWLVPAVSFELFGKSVKRFFLNFLDLRAGGASTVKAYGSTSLSLALATCSVIKGLISVSFGELSSSWVSTIASGGLSSFGSSIYWLESVLILMSIGCKFCCSLFISILRLWIYLTVSYWFLA